MFHTAFTASGSRVILVHSEDTNPEHFAMLCAMYSRDPGSILNRLTASMKSQDFMDKYYVGYGHNSIGDNGSFYLFFEDISQIASVALEYNPLFNGQESSTRYLDFQNQPFFNPLDYEDGVDFQELTLFLAEQRNLYAKALATLTETLQTEMLAKHPDKKPELVAKQARIKAFDVCRSLLPCSAATNVAWNATLRNARDHLALMYAHPAKEVRELAETTLELCHLVFPGSGFITALETARSEASAFSTLSWSNSTLAESPLKLQNTHIQEPTPITSEVKSSTYPINVRLGQVNIPDLFAMLKQHTQTAEALKQRPRGAMLPRSFNLYGHIVVECFIDYAGYRDIQRHRNQFNSFALPSTSAPFHQWYLDNLPPDLNLSEFLSKAAKLAQKSEGLCVDPYVTCMGALVPLRMSLSIPQFVYLLETRGAATVHPTVRSLMSEIAHTFRETSETHAMIWDCLNVQVDFGREDVNMRRATQDIFKR